MKILFLTDGIHPLVVGGMQKHSTMLIKNLSQKKVKICLIHSGNRSGTQLSVKDIFSEQELKNIELIEIPFVDRSRLPGHYIRANKRYSKQIYLAINNRLGDFDIIYCKGFTAYSFLKAKERGDFSIPICCKLHGYEMFVPIPGYIRKIQQIGLRKIARYITQKSDFVFSYGGKITSLLNDLDVQDSQILVCPGGIEANWVVDKIRRTNGSRRFLFVGRYERRKGIHELHEVIKKMVKIGYDFECHFIGPIPSSDQLLLSECTYYGLVTDPHVTRDIYDLCDVLICPSYSEGMPNVIFEGMARGLAIIGTNVGAVSCQVETNGWLITAGKVDELFNSMKAALTIPETQLDHMKNDSLNAMNEKFVWEKVTLKFMVLIDRIKAIKS